MWLGCVVQNRFLGIIVENGLNNFAGAADYINQVRARAYGYNGDLSGFSTAYPAEVYAAGDFADNELAILHERDKEFVLECSRWFDFIKVDFPTLGFPTILTNPDLCFISSDFSRQR